MKYLVLGAGGMAGHLIVHYLLEQGEVVEGVARRNLSYCKTHILDVTDFAAVEDVINSGDYDVAINCVGLLNQTAENDPAAAIQINAYLPHFLAKVTRNRKTRIFQMSTDCVFSGKTGHYTETDIPEGDTFYARSKALGELNDEKNLTFRNSIVGPDINENGIGLFNWFMRQDGPISGYEKSIWTGVTTLTLAKAMHTASYSHLTGLYNLVNNTVINKYQLVCLFNEATNKNLTITAVPGIDHDKSLVNTRTDFNFIVPSYKEQVNEMVQWILNHSDMYHYKINS